MEEQNGKDFLRSRRSNLTDSPLVVEPTSSSAAVAPASAPAYSYDDLFPALPESATPKFSVPTINKLRIGSSIVTQVSTCAHNSHGHVK